MEHWSVREDDRPYLRPRRSTDFWVPALAILLLLVAGGALFYYLVQPPLDLPFSLPGTERAEPVAPRTAAPSAPSAPPPEAPEPAIRHPLPSTAQAPAASLPALDDSDAMMHESVSGLIGRKAFAENIIPGQLVRHIVTTVDNLPRRTAPRRVMPLQRVPGSFLAAPHGDAASIQSANFARYRPYVRTFETVDGHALVQSYMRAYSLFQRAYEELGYPGKYFNDRLIEAIDDMLAAPEIDGPIELVQPKVLYQFADPALEACSAGQKILMRMGKANALRVKAKLRAIRAELLVAGKTSDPARRAPEPVSR